MKARKYPHFLCYYYFCSLMAPSLFLYTYDPPPPPCNFPMSHGINFILKPISLWYYHQCERGNSFDWHSQIYYSDNNDLQRSNGGGGDSLSPQRRIFKYHRIQCINKSVRTNWQDQGVILYSTCQRKFVLGCAGSAIRVFPWCGMRIYKT